MVEITETPFDKVDFSIEEGDEERIEQRQKEARSVLAGGVVLQLGDGDDGA